MELRVYEAIRSILKNAISGTKFENHVYTVGGCERDRLMKKPIKDIDLVVDLPQGGIELSKFLYKKGLLTHAPVTYENFGTSMFSLKTYPDIELEAVQTRKECYRDADSRNPETTFGSIEDDCQRRDFTYNAIYRNVSSDDNYQDFNGNSINDLNANILRTCGSPDIIFTEDPLRILRAIRFACKYQSTIEGATYNGMIKYVDRLSIISKERICDELIKMLTLKSEVSVDMAIKDLYNIGAMAYIFPQLHSFDYRVIARIAMAAAYYRMRWDDNYILSLSIIMSYIKSDERKDTLKNLKFSNDVIDNVLFITNKACELDNMTDITDKSVRRFEYECKTEEMFNDICFVCEHTRLSYNRNSYTIKDFVEKHKRNKTDMFGYRLPIDGNDVMKYCNLEPSKQVSNILNYFLNAAFDHPKMWTRKKCIELMEVKTKYNTEWK